MTLSWFMQCEILWARISFTDTVNTLLIYSFYHPYTAPKSDNSGKSEGACRFPGCPWPSLILATHLPEPRPFSWAPAAFPGAQAFLGFVAGVSLPGMGTDCRLAG
ncbi:uncharacterized protein LOC143282522 [Babylonia areolata]|uniref:uncharacterized protein LOC143282522 n=1 Tax=Babylonia areolata TaxID=304850 RepID=UPI003FCFF77F